MGKRARKLIDHESSLQGMIMDAMAAITTLAEEMREAYDNTPESLQSSGAGEARGEAADNLENISEPDVPDWLENVNHKWQSFPGPKRPSRAARRDEAVEMLRQVMERLDELKEEKSRSEEEREQAEALRDEIENIIDEAEAVEFPGMFG